MKIEKNKLVLIMALLLTSFFIMFILTCQNKQQKTKLEITKVFDYPVFSFTTIDKNIFYYLDKDRKAFYKYTLNNKSNEKILNNNLNITKVIWSVNSSSIKAILQTEDNGQIRYYIANFNLKNIYPLESDSLDVVWDSDDRIATLQTENNQYFIKITTPQNGEQIIQLNRERCDKLIYLNQQSNQLICLAFQTDISALLKVINLSDYKTTIINGDFSSAKISPNGSKILALKNNNDSSFWVFLSNNGDQIAETKININFYNINKTVWDPTNNFVISAARTNGGITDNFYIINATTGESNILDIKAQDKQIDAQNLLISLDNKILYFISDNKLYKKEL